MKLKRVRHKFLLFGFITFLFVLTIVIVSGSLGKERKAKFEAVSAQVQESLKLTDQINDLNNSFVYYLFRFRMNRDPQFIYDALTYYSENQNILSRLKEMGGDPRDGELIEDLHDAYSATGGILADLARTARQENWVKLDAMFDQVVLAQTTLRATLNDLRARRAIYLQKRFDTFKTMYDWMSDLSVGIAVLGLIAVLLLISFYEFIFLRPLNAISRALQNTHESQLELEIPALYKDELGELYTALRRAWAEVRHRLDIETRLNKELRSLNQGLKHFSQIASHDLKEPLAALLLYTDLAEAELGPTIDPQIKTNFDQIRSICQRMRSMIDGLLALFNANRKDLQMEKICLEQPLSEALRNLTPMIEGRGVIITKPDDMPFTIGNTSQLVELFQNLIGNGIKYNKSDMPHIMISVSRALKAGDPHILTISDNGIGVPVEQRDAIFSFFVRGIKDSEIKGSGVGLALCKKIVEQHGGEIWVDSNIPQGSRFSFSLPSAPIN